MLTVKLQKWQALLGATTLLNLVRIRIIRTLIVHLFSANISEREHYQWRDALQVLAPKLWRPPPDVVTAWSNTTSIVIVRHPMSRLASVYYQKFVELSDNEGWARLIEYIIDTYRKDNETGPAKQPTPNEFIRYDF